MSDGIGKAEGFRDETYLIVPTESFAEYMEHPLVRGAYLTDVGFFRRQRSTTGSGKRVQTSIS